MARLLVIDDDDLLRAVLVKALVKGGHEVIDAADGLRGVQLSRVNAIDLVVTDLIMPVQEGVETIVTLRQEQPDLPIIAMSGGLPNSGLYLNIAGRVGAQRVLAKPFKPADLLAAVDDVLSRRGPRKNEPPDTSSGGR
jgi:CheY-like chemotaxis protein